MKKIFKIFTFLIVGFILFLLIGFGIFYFQRINQSKSNLALLLSEPKDLIIDGVKFRDLNKNGKLDLYEDYREPIESRLDDLLSQMTLEEKAGTMFINIIGMTGEGDLLEYPVLSTDPIAFIFSFIFPSNSEQIILKHMNNFNIVNSYASDILARYNNNIQKIMVYPESINKNHIILDFYSIYVLHQNNIHRYQIHKLNMVLG